MSDILTEPFIVERLKREPKRFVFSVDISHVPMNKRVQCMNNWKQFLKRHHELIELTSPKKTKYRQ